MAKVIGIDLGTTNSCVAVIEGGEPVVIAKRRGCKNHSVGCRFLKDRRENGRPGCKASGNHKSRENRFFDKETYGLGL